jgi:uncharacterized protein (TIGR00255 family)
MPPFLSPYEQKVRELVRDRFQRGKVYITTTIQNGTQDLLGIRIEPKTAVAIRQLLEELREATGIKEELRLEHVLKFSEIFQPVNGNGDTDATWTGIQQALEKALDNLNAMRRNEGDALTKDLDLRIRILDGHLDTIERISKETSQQTFDKLSERVRKLLDGKEPASERIDMEVALLADKLDVTEECVRMRCHHRLFRETLEKESAVGKKLTFLLQEMNREANTISAKSLSTDISHLVVGIKDEIEKLREQVQNLE